VSSAEFEVQDVRQLDQRFDLQNSFDVVVCCENIEHILNDRKLMVDISHCLKSGGTLLLTTPNFNYIPISKGDEGPFSEFEDGGHVRRGYTPERLKDLCASAGLKVLKIGYCSGFISQKVTALLRTASKLHPLVGWVLILPLRVLPPLGDPWISKITSWPGFLITLIATKV
jgi:SAM-dependent methyltransferase